MTDLEFCAIRDVPNPMKSRRGGGFARSKRSATSPVAPEDAERLECVCLSLNIAQKEGA
jgi:hypothetical protein